MELAQGWSDTNAHCTEAQKNLPEESNAQAGLQINCGVIA